MDIIERAKAAKFSGSLPNSLWKKLVIVVFGKEITEFSGRYRVVWYLYANKLYIAECKHLY